MLMHCKLSIHSRSRSSCSNQHSQVGTGLKQDQQGLLREPHLLLRLHLLCQPWPPAPLIRLHLEPQDPLLDQEADCRS
jgi:hypothetical protein